MNGNLFPFMNMGILYKTREEHDLIDNQIFRNSAIMTICHGRKLLWHTICYYMGRCTLQKTSQNKLDNNKNKKIRLWEK